MSLSVPEYDQSRSCRIICRTYRSLSNTCENSEDPIVLGEVQESFELFKTFVGMPEMAQNCSNQYETDIVPFRTNIRHIGTYRNQLYTFSFRNYIICNTYIVLQSLPRIYSILICVKLRSIPVCTSFSHNILQVSLSFAKIHSESIKFTKFSNFPLILGCY